MYYCPRLSSQTVWGVTDDIERQPSPHGCLFYISYTLLLLGTQCRDRSSGEDRKETQRKAFVLSVAPGLGSYGATLPRTELS